MTNSEQMLNSICFGRLSQLIDLFALVLVLIPLFVFSIFELVICNSMYTQNHSLSDVCDFPTNRIQIRSILSRVQSIGWMFIYVYFQNIIQEVCTSQRTIVCIDKHIIYYCMACVFMGRIVFIGYRHDTAFADCDSNKQI